VVVLPDTIISGEVKAMTSNRNSSARIEVSHTASPGLSREQRAAIDQPIEHAAGLPGECYTSAEWKRIEQLFVRV